MYLETWPMKFGLRAIVTMDPENPRTLKSTPEIVVSALAQVSRGQGGPAEKANAK